MRGTVCAETCLHTRQSDRSEDWLSLVEDFTTATRQEEGDLFFE